MSSSNGGGARGIDASIWGISDPELLAIVDDLADEQGWTSSLDVRLQLGEKVEEVAHSGIPQRLAWGVRFEWLERHPDRALYRLTDVGHAILDGGSLTRAIERALEKLNPAQRIQLTRELSTAGRGAVKPIQDALRREWQRNLLRR